MPITTALKTIYPGPMQLMLFTSKPTLWGETRRILYEDDSMLLKISLGTKQGYAPAIAAHEACHAAEYIMKRNDWREWASHWDCTYQREETQCALVESIVRSSMAFAFENKIAITNPNRFMGGTILTTTQGN